VKQSIFFILILLFGNVFAQERLSVKKYERPLMMPRKYSMIQNELDVKVENDFSHDLWVVLSDRDDNVTYQKPDSTSQIATKISFLDAFYVAAESGEYVLLAKADLRRGSFVDNENAQSFGWIHKRNLILSKNSLKDEHHIYQKALVINSIDQIEKVFEREKLNSLLYRKGPGQEYAEKDTSRVFHIYFVLKTNRTPTTEPSMYLLARKSLLYSVGNLQTIQEANDAIILGWIPTGSITPWNHRVALEQNWDLSAVEQRNRHKIPAEIFLDEKKFNPNSSSESLTNLSQNAVTILSDDSYYETFPSLKNATEQQKIEALNELRLDGYNMRYPIINDYGDELYSVGFIGDVYISRLKKMTAIQEAEGQRIVQQIKSDYQQTNIVFVVDATNSMTPYLRTVAKGIQSAMNQLSQQSNIKFGGVIYRDGDDEIPPPKELTKKTWEVAEYFHEQKGMSKQVPFPESMYSGILRGLEETGFKAGQNNSLVLISDVGDHRVNETMQEEKIAELINKYNCNFLAIQVNRKSRSQREKEANDDFYLQNSRIIHKAITKSETLLNQTPKFIPPAGKLENSLKEYNAVGPLFLGRALPIQVGVVMKESALEEYILTFIRSTERNSEMVVQNLDDIAQGRGIQKKNALEAGVGSDVTRNDLSELTLNMMKRANLDFTIIDKIKEKRFQLYVNGLVKNRFTLENGKLSEPLFKKVILISANDMRRLHAIFGECFHEDFRLGEPDNIRLAEGWREFVGKLAGNFSPEQRETLQEFNTKTIAELTEMTFGIPSDSKFANLSLQDILELKPFNPRDKQIIDELKHHIRLKYEQLDQSILNKGNQYKYAFYIDDVLYYWISADDLP
jgi:hypothetical protein